MQRLLSCIAALATIPLPLNRRPTPTSTGEARFTLQGILKPLWENLLELTQTAEQSEEQIRSHDMKGLREPIFAVPLDCSNSDTWSFGTASDLDGRPYSESMISHIHKAVYQLRNTDTLFSPLASICSLKTMALSRTSPVLAKIIS